MAPERQPGADQHTNIFSPVQMSSWLPEELHACTHEQPSTNAPDKAAYLAMWDNSQTRLWQQPQRQQEPQSQ